MPRADTKERIKRLKYYLSNPRTRDEAYVLTARDFNISVGAVKMTASRGGVASRSHSKRYLLSVKDEEAFVDICLKYARRGVPLTLPDFLEMTRRFKGYAKNRQFSRHFAYDFIKRHKETLCFRTEKVTSPARSSDTMDQETEKFITEVEPLVDRNSINKNNLFVFDETYIGDPVVNNIVSVNGESLVVETSMCFRSVGKH